MRTALEIRRDLCRLRRFGLIRGFTTKIIKGRTHYTIKPQVGSHFVTYTQKDMNDYLNAWDEVMPV